MSDTSWAGRRVLITGASSGIGAASELGGIDVLVNNAALALAGRRRQAEQLAGREGE